MTSLRKNLLVIFLFILVGCMAPRLPAPPPTPPAPPSQEQPPAQPAIPLAQDQPATAPPAAPPPPEQPAQPSVAPVQEQPQPGPTSNQPSQEPDVPANSTGADVSPTAVSQGNSVDLTHLPIGDHKVSTSPQRDYVWSCETSFNGSGAFATGSWFNAAAGTFDYTAKPSVDGAVTWPHDFTISLEGNLRVIASNDLPDHPTGVYPVSPNDDAFQYDRNPNSIKVQSLRLELPAQPALAAQPSCIRGTIGILLSGAMLYNAFDAGGRDAVAHEIQDGCQGHPESQGNYHYHNLSSCLNDGEPGSHSSLVGYAFDGFGIYGHQGENGETLTNADLDECHGHTHMIEWDGQQVEMYHYHATWEFPYTVGCYRGTSTVDIRQLMGGQGGQPGSPPNGAPAGQPGQGQPQQQGGQSGGHPDLAAAAAQLGLSEQQLREALGPPPPDFSAAAAKLGLSEQALRQALGAP